MKKKVKRNSKDNYQNKVIEKALRIGGFLFPETIEEVKEFERIFGKTDIILPPAMQEPSFLRRNSKIRRNSQIARFAATNFAMAAREGSSKIPNSIKLKIIADIKDAEAKNKKKRN